MNQCKSANLLIKKKTFSGNRKLHLWMLHPCNVFNRRAAKKLVYSKGLEAKRKVAVEGVLLGNLRI